MSPLFTILTLLLTPAGVQANYLSYLDENGTKHIVQTESEIPEKYRTKVQVSRAGDPENTRAALAGASAEKTSQLPATGEAPAPGSARNEEFQQLQGQLSQVLQLQQNQEDRRLRAVEAAQYSREQAAARAKAKAAKPNILPVVKVGR
jgi:hypothetical protein